MEYGLTDNQLKQLLQVFLRYPDLEKVILYGSRAKGNYHSGSDIDLTLVGMKLDKSDVNKIENEIDDLLLPFLFDISILHQISNPNLLDHIQRIGKILYEKELSKDEQNK